MRTVKRTAYDPDTGIVMTPSEIEFPPHVVIQQAILDLEWPLEERNWKWEWGPKEVADILAEKWELSNKEKTAVTQAGEPVFYHVVAYDLGQLVKQNKLERNSGKYRPTGAVPLEEFYQNFIADVASKLLQQISEKSPAFFEKLVNDVLTKMGHRGTLTDA